MIEEVHPNDFVLNSGGRRVVVDVSALGGVTAAITKGQTIAAIGTMAPDKRQFRAVRLEPATASALKPTAR